MAGTALTAVPELYATGATLDESIANGIVGSFTFRTRYPDPPAEVTVFVGPMAAADLQDDTTGQAAIIAARDVGFANLVVPLNSEGLALT